MAGPSKSKIPCKNGDKHAAAHVQVEGGYWKLMQDESYMAFLDMVALDLPKPSKVKTPLLILGAARDNMLRPSEIEATARAYHTQFEIIPDVAHNSMLELRWQTVAERIVVWLKNEVVARALRHGHARVC